MEQISNDPWRRPLRALVNNAGMGVNAPLETHPLTEWRRLFDVSLFGHVAMMQALLPALIESRGTIVNLSSIGGKAAMAAYIPMPARSSPLKLLVMHYAAKSGRLS